MWLIDLMEVGSLQWDASLSAMVSIAKAVGACVFVCVVIELIAAGGWCLSALWLCEQLQPHSPVFAFSFFPALPALSFSLISPSDIAQRAVVLGAQV